MLFAVATHAKGGSGPIVREANQLTSFRHIDFPCRAISSKYFLDGPDDKPLPWFVEYPVARPIKRRQVNRKRNSQRRLDSSDLFDRRIRLKSASIGF